MEYKRCEGCHFYSDDIHGCTASFYERVQSNCEKNAKSIKLWLQRLDTLDYMEDGEAKQQQMLEINEILEALIV